MLGQLLSHFRILEQIGAGGMGVVYRAHDERLDRDVALKILPAGLLADEAARKRFRKEALALAKLNHPNIAAVYDFDIQDGTDFLVMEFISGVALSDTLASGSLPENDILRLGTQLAEGLAAAHEQGIVHRDLKPGNLRITPDGRLKILDFGLAKLLRPETHHDVTASVTEPHAVSGTLPYMAPEQLRGEEVDQRIDIWALGTVLYEMATGRRPFEGKLATALAGDIQYKPVAPPSQLSPNTSSRLEEIIIKCLEKDPENRYQSAKEVAVDLRRLGSATGSAVVGRGARTFWHRRNAVRFAIALIVVLTVVVGLRIKDLRQRLLGKFAGDQIRSVAVPLMRNFTGDPALDRFADSLTTALVAYHSKQPNVAEIPLTRSNSGNWERPNVRAIASTFDADAVLETSLVRDGGRVRVTAQLVQASNEKRLWVKEFERGIQDKYALYCDVAAGISAELSAKGRSEQKDEYFVWHSGGKREKGDFRRQGYGYLDGWSPEGLRKAKESFLRATQEEPGDASARAGLAAADWLLARYDLLPSRQNYLNAFVEATDALKADSTSIESRIVLGWVRIELDQDWVAGEEYLRQALVYGPCEGWSQWSYASYLSATGHLEESVAEMQLALNHRPTSVVINGSLGEVLYFARRYDEAEAQFRGILISYPNHVWAHSGLMMVYEEKQAYKQAAQAFRDFVTNYTASGIVLDKTDSPNGYPPDYSPKAYWRWRLAALEKAAKNGTQVSAVEFARIYEGLGEKDKAIAWLQRAFEQREGRLIYLQVEPAWNSLRSDPHFQDLVRRMNFPP
jgi:eukaryotic-like serine/threonine-protein kinase